MWRVKLIVNFVQLVFKTFIRDMACMKYDEGILTEYSPQPIIHPNLAYLFLGRVLGYIARNFSNLRIGFN